MPPLRATLQQGSWCGSGAWPDHCRCLARKKGLWAPWETDTIYQTYLVLYTLMARYWNYDITWTNHVCTRRPAATANKDSETKGNRNETNERIQQVPAKRVPTFFGIFAPGFATGSASFSLLQGVLSCSEFLGMEHGAIRSAPWIKWVDWIVHHMNCESYGIKNVKRYLLLQYTRKSIYLCILSQISLMTSRYFSETSLVPLFLRNFGSPSSLEQLQPQVVATRLYLRSTCGISFNLSHFQHVEIIAFQNCLQERRAQACLGKLTIVHSQIFIVAIYFHYCSLTYQILVQVWTFTYFNLFQSSNVRFHDIPNVRSSRIATGRRRRGTRSTSNDSNSVTRAWIKVKM